MEQSRAAAPSVTRVDRWRYRSALHAARVLNSIGRVDQVPVTMADERTTRRQPQSQGQLQIPRPRGSS